MKLVLGEVTGQIPTQLITIAKGRLPEGSRLWQGLWLASPHSPVSQTTVIFFPSQTRAGQGTRSTSDRYQLKMIRGTELEADPALRGPSPPGRTTPHVEVPASQGGRARGRADARSQLGLGQDASETETHGAETQGSSRLFSPRAHGPGEVGGYVPPPHLEEIIFTNHRTEPRENAWVESLGFWQLPLRDMGRSQGPHPRVSHPNAKQARAGDHLQKPLRPHLPPEAAFLSPCVALEPGTEKGVSHRILAVGTVSSLSHCVPGGLDYLPPSFTTF